MHSFGCARRVAGILLVAACASVAGAIVISPDASGQNLTPNLAILPLDSEVDDLASLRHLPFKPVQTQGINIGLRETAVWLRLDLAVEASEPRPIYLELSNPRLGLVDLYEERNGVVVHVASTGVSVPHAQRPLPHRSLVLPIQLTGQSSTFFLRVNNRGSMRFSVRVWRPERFLESLAWEQLVLGVFYGLLLAMALYHVSLYISLHEPIYLHFVLLIVAYGLFQAALFGIAQQLVWPHATWWADRSVLFFNGLSMFFAFTFSNHFLDLARRLPYMFGIFAAMIVLSLFVSAGAFLPSLHANLLAHLLGIVGPAALFGAAAYLYWTGVRTARLFLFAWTAALVGTTVFALMGFGLLPENVVTQNGIHVGFSAALLLFSLALADRVKCIELAHRQRLVAFNGMLQQQLAECSVQIRERGDRLRELAVRLTQAEQAARRKLAQGLHDHLQQLLVAAQLRLAQLNKSPLDAESRERLAEADALIVESIQSARNLAVELNPPVLQRAGFEAGLHWLAKLMETRHGLNVVVSFEPSIAGIAEEHSVLLFEITRELLFNVVKHAHTDFARIQVARDPSGWLRVTVEDRGVGFLEDADAAATASDLGLGLGHIRERLGYLGGRMRITSGLNQGTRIEIETPFATTEG